MSPDRLPPTSITTSPEGGNMDMRALDNWITSAPEFAPTVITQARYADWHDGLRVNERECDKCGKTVGYSDWDNNDVYGLAFIEYLRIDEDDEVNRCEFCVSEDDWNESVR